jgi:predicted metal-dependent HD superfamily phosphohydrolase
MAAANEKQWLEFWQRIGVGGNPLLPWQRLHAAYTETWRAYHNLDHIGHCLEELATIPQLADDPLALEAAIWFHDAIYDTHRKDNEVRSAELANAILRDAGKANSFSETVQMLILATKHQSQPTSQDAGLVSDIDLSILGQSAERYADFERQIRHEYAWVSDQDFAAGRSAVLNGFLQRECIYNSPTFARQYEAQARMNLAWAIKQLAG